MKHEIIIYEDARGRAPLREYLKKLKSQKDDDSRIRIGKIQDYISLLQEKGTMLPKPVCKHFFGQEAFVAVGTSAGWRPCIILRMDWWRVRSVACIQKEKPENARRRTSQSGTRIQRLDRKEWRNMSNKHLTWDELEAEIFTPEEIAESRARVEIISSIIDARQAKGLSQKELAEITGIKQPAIARLENGHISPSVDTINRLLAPLGKRLAVVDA